MINKLKEFFKDHKIDGKPLLLAFSGGPDSLTLLHLLLEYRQAHPLQFAIAHIDHGWRDESASEAMEIKEMAKKLGIICHLKKISPEELSGNLEAACREERLRYFASLCAENGYQAVLLAHHSDDVSETVLKRMLEGATLPYLDSIRPESMIHGMKVWRPLLSVKKSDLLLWLDERGLKGLNDRTNHDPKFLRARFRTQVIPYLSETFGKEIYTALRSISDEAGELRDYLDERVDLYLKGILKGKRGVILDLSVSYPNSLFELKYLIRKFCKQNEFGISREAIAEAAAFVMERTANKLFESGGKYKRKTLHIDRGRLFIPSEEFPSLPDISVRIEDNTPSVIGNWVVQQTLWSNSEPHEPTDWLNIWLHGKGEVVLPKGQYELCNPPSSLAKQWTDHKIPAFFRNKVPVIMENGLLQHEFLTGKNTVSQKIFTRENIKLILSEVSG